MQKSTDWRGYMLAVALLEVWGFKIDICWTSSKIDGCRTCSNHRDTLICDPVLEQRHEACIVSAARGLSVSAVSFFSWSDSTKTEMSWTNARGSIGAWIRNIDSAENGLTDLVYNFC